jgi:hypothetical protein
MNSAVSNTNHAANTNMSTNANHSNSNMNR